MGRFFPGILVCFIFLNQDNLEIEANSDDGVFTDQLHPLSSASSSPNQPYRTAYHFQPPNNWMNDPNGPMVYNGIYHFFYQYNPNSPVWETYIVWGHSTSIDLVNWMSHEPALKPSQPYDINGCWSGSATILQGNNGPAMLYTGIDLQNHQVQNLALPKNLADPFLIEWVKSPQNPLMTPNPINNINSTLFRDPSTAWLGPDGSWRVIVGSKMNGRGAVLLYRSKDFVQWTQTEQPLHSSNSSYEMWECPDFYPVSTGSQDGLDTSVNGEGIKHVLKASLFELAHEYYTVGTYDPVKDVFNPVEGSVDNAWGLRYDYGKFYASKTFFDSEKNRRVLWGWINESTNATIDIMKGWSGVQAIPRKIWLDESEKQLLQWPIEEIEKLRENRVYLPKKMLEEGSIIEVSGVTGAQADIEISFEIKDFKKAEPLDIKWTNPQDICSQEGLTGKGGLGPFGLLVLASKNLEEYTAVFFRIFRGQNKYLVLMCSDQKRSSLLIDYDKTTYGAFVDVDPVHDELSLRILIDHSIVESFGAQGKVCITSRVYPTLAIDDEAHLYVFNNGTESVRMKRLRTWNLKNAQINLNEESVDS